jgi:predicted NAD/FAD-dependent oxidoreductase
MRVAVVGAGLAGLGAAREVVARGHEAVVFEKSRGLGGRLAARRAGDTVLDHGSRVVAAPQGTGLRALVDALDPGDRVDLGDGIAFAGGATRLPKLMAAALDVRLGVRLAALRAAGGGFELGDEQGNTHGTADAVVVSAPAPQAADLLERSPEAGERVAALREVGYAPAVMALVGLRLDPRAVRVAAAGARGPIAEVRAESVKGRPPVDGVQPVVVRLDERASADLLDASDAAVLGRLLPALAALAGPSAAEPAWAQVKRWRYAVPTGLADASAVNPPGVRIVVAGDALTGAGFGSSDHHRVYESGVLAARRVCA